MSYQTCSFFGGRDATKDEITKEIQKNARDWSNKCSNLYLDCGTPVLSSIPGVNLLFPRDCATRGDVMGNARADHEAKIKLEQEK